jgi:Uma2 family endonuclease
MVIQDKLYTAADLWQLSHSPEYAGKRLELSKGVLIVMSPSGGKHGDATYRLAGIFFTRLEGKHLGYTTGAETGYILFTSPEGKDIVRAPDLGFVRAEHLPEGLPDGYIPFAPDLAVEVVSPNDSATDIAEKVEEYLQHGTRMVWVFYPKLRNVVVHKPPGISQTFGLDDTLDGGEVLPGFTLHVRDIFGE